MTLQTQVDRDNAGWVVKTSWVGDFSQTTYMPYEEGDTEWSVLRRYFAQEEVRLV